ncbi:FAD-dependent oxidoreductase [Jiangella sp. DSM 45060]|uniref:FAD-dependent oxidoreductase n=1 Tax=Jiangella sp. DSM 45060 TaxID=1798224 RepID=UPI00087C88D6|nr:FAD-dependent oxidoreductase [Jiangella sp. DSM 45060]SDT42963.1 2-polyprenyl-6-methoxyphenol hydroxylase [Jiangella sp. DSM 45060]
MIPTTTDVLVVGAGPTGLTLATVLAEHGHQVLIVDGRAAADTTSRAAVVHAHTLEALEPYGVSDRLTALGIHAPRFTIRDRDRVLVPVPFDRLPTAYPYTLMISQAVTERVLLDRLTELGGQVLRPHRLTTLEQTGDGVVAGFAGGAEVRAGYVVGADGMHSVVREQAGISFDGDAYAESFALADVRLTGGAPDDEVILYFSPAGMVVVAPLPGGVHRVVATVADAPEHPDAAFVQQLLDTRGPLAERAEVHEVVWGSRFRLHHRVAGAYRRGRILLAGDAAHVHSPAGGQGMNAGITDAVALGVLLHEVLDGAPDEVLDAYESARRPVATEVVALADRLTRLATAGPVARPARNVALRLLGTVPAFRNRLARRLSGLVYR